MHHLQSMNRAACAVTVPIKSQVFEQLLQDVKLLSYGIVSVLGRRGDVLINTLMMICTLVGLIMAITKSYTPVKLQEAKIPS